MIEVKDDVEWYYSHAGHQMQQLLGSFPRQGSNVKSMKMLMDCPTPNKD